MRHTLNLGDVPAGVTKAKDDNIVHALSVDPATGRMQSASGYGHPICSPGAATIAEGLSNSLLVPASGRTARRDTSCD